MLNNIALVGRIASDLELKVTENGKKFVNFCLAVQRDFKNQNGEYETDFMWFSVWEKTAEYMESNVEKGDSISVSGRLSTRQRDIEGKEVTMLEVIPRQVNLVSRSLENAQKRQSK